LPHPAFVATRVDACKTRGLCGTGGHGYIAI